MTACDSSHCDRSYQEGNDNQPFSAAAMLIWVPASHCLDPVVPKDGHNAQDACEKCNGCFKADPGLRWLHAASPHLAAGRAQNDCHHHPPLLMVGIRLCSPYLPRTTPAPAVCHRGSTHWSTTPRRGPPSSNSTVVMRVGCGITRISDIQQAPWRLGPPQRSASSRCGLAPSASPTLHAARWLAAANVNLQIVHAELHRQSLRRLSASVT